MKRGLALISLAVVVALGAVAVAGAKTQDTTLSGAGSTFVAPLVSTWTPALGSAFGYTVQYSAVGSGAGIAAITNRQVDFGASDAPMSPDADHRVQRLRPDSVGAGRDHRRLQRPGCARCTCGSTARRSRTSSSGTSRNWNDPAIAALNPGANLPNLKITPVFRSDGSGTSYNFSDYLSSVSPEWKSKIGVSTAAGLPGRCRGEGLRRRRRRRQEHAGRRDLRRRRVRAGEPHPVRGGQERRREVPLSRASGGSSPRRRRSRRSGRTTRCTS